MNAMRYNPLGLTALHQQINRIFDQFDEELGGRSEELGGGMFSPAMDVKEDPDAFTVLLEAPGVKRENIEITLQNGTLLIRGTREVAAEKQEGQFRRVERSYGSFARSLTLSRQVDANTISAQLEDGLLTVRPKAEESKPRQISIGSTHSAGRELASDGADGQGQAGAGTSATEPTDESTPNGSA